MLSQYTSLGGNLGNKQFLLQQPKPFISFLTEVTGDSKKYRICLPIEQLYFIRHFMFMGPLCRSY